VRESAIDRDAIAADDLPDGTLFATATGAGEPWGGHPVVREVADLLVAWEPELVIGQPIDNFNPDHYAAAQIVAIAWQVAAEEADLGPYLIPVGPPGGGRLRFPPLEPDRFVDVTGYEDTCLRALACHRSQGGHLPETQERRRKSWTG
jgi:LmbE family N-acetylglucosaminyl deacetylase